MARRQLLRGALIVSLSRLVAYAMSFVRNLVLARFLSETDYGLASLLATVATLFELSGKLSFGIQIVQSSQGDCGRFIGSTHYFQFLTASFAFVGLLSASPILGLWFDFPDFQAAFVVVSLTFLFKAFENLDCYRLQRSFKFLPVCIYEVLPQVAITLLVFPSILLFKDFRAALALVVVRGLVSLAVSHIVAGRRYSWCIDRELLSRIWSFGWPLLVANILLASSQQVDQLVIGALKSPQDLAFYSVAFSLVSVPWFVVAQAASSVLLPLFSKVQSSSVEFFRIYSEATSIFALVSIVVYAPISLGAPLLVHLIYGPKYFAASAPLSILAAAFALRQQRFCLSVAAIARGDPRNEAFSNAVRLVSLPAASVLAICGFGITAISCSAVMGEVAAGVFAIWRFYRVGGGSVSASIRSGTYVIGFSMSVVVATLCGWLQVDSIQLVYVALPCICLYVAIGFVVFPELRARASEVYARVRSRLVAQA